MYDKQGVWNRIKPTRILQNSLLYAAFFLIIDRYIKCKIAF